MRAFFFFFFNDTATTEIYTLSLHDALPILRRSSATAGEVRASITACWMAGIDWYPVPSSTGTFPSLAGVSITRERSEEHTSELQSQSNLVCRLLLEKKKHTAVIVFLSEK